jgi:antitoxin MazE
MGAIKTRIVRIGNSQGVRLPKSLIEQCQLQGELELEPHSDYLIIRAVAKPRAGWEQAFQTMAEHRDDQLPDDHRALEHDWDRDEWEWS